MTPGNTILFSRNPGRSVRNLIASNSCMQMILCSWQNCSIDELLTVRDKQFVKYLKVREKLVNDQSFTSQLQKFNDMVTKNELEADSTVVTSEKRTTTTTVVPQEEKPRGFFNKIFGKKKSDEEADAGIRITNEENIKRDTIALSTEGKMVKGVEQSLKAMEREQQRKSRTFMAREAVLAEANNLLIVQMLDILREVEQQAVAQFEENSVQAKTGGEYRHQADDHHHGGVLPAHGVAFIFNPDRHHPQ